MGPEGASRRTSSQRQRFPVFPCFSLLASAVGLGARAAKPMALLHAWRKLAALEGQVTRRRAPTKATPIGITGQLHFDFDSPAPPVPARPENQPRSRPRRRPARSLEPQFYPGCLGERPPPPRSGEQPLNTKRAAHFLGKRVKWLETVRHRPNSPPWIKTGGGFEYFESQLTWWRALLSEGMRDPD